MRYSVRPSSALFSGWNWVAKMLSRATAEVKRDAIVGQARAVARVRRRGVKTVHKVEPRAVGHARPQCVRPAPAGPGSSPSAAPCSGCRRAAAAPSRRKRSTRPPIRPRPGVSCSSLWSSSICMPTQTPNSGLLRGGVQHRVLQSRRVQLAHAVAHRALAGQHHALGGEHVLRPRGHDAPRRRCRPPRAAPPATPSAGCPCRSRRRRRCPA